MRLRNLLGFSLVLLSLAIFVGCQTSSGGGGGGDNTNNELDNGDGEGDPGGDVVEDGDGEGGTEDGDDAPADDEPADEEPADDGTGEGDPGDDPGDEVDPAELTEEEVEDVNEFVTLLESLTSVFAALGAAELPSTEDLPLEVTNPVTGCPTVTIDEGLLIIDFGEEGCTPVLYPESTFSGTITGEVIVADREILLTFDAFTIDGDTVDGTIQAAVSTEGDLIILEGTFDLVISSETDPEANGTITGEGTIEINVVTGEVVIPYAEGSSTDTTGDTYGFVLEAVHSDPVNNVNFLPDSGTATLIFGTVGPGALEIEITFTEGTPTDGTVLVSVNGSPQVTLTLEDVEEDIVEEIEG